MQLCRRNLIGALEIIAGDLLRDTSVHDKPVTHEEINNIANELLEWCCLTPEHVRPTLTLIQGGRGTPPDLPPDLPPLPSGDAA